MALVTNDIFDADDNTMKLSHGLAICPALIQLPRLYQNFFCVNVYECIQTGQTAYLLQVMTRHSLTGEGTIPKPGMVFIYGNMLIQEQALGNRGYAGARLLGLLFLHAFLDLALHIRLGVIEFADATTQSPHEFGDLSASEEDQYSQHDEDPL